MESFKEYLNLYKIIGKSKIKQLNKVNLKPKNKSYNKKLKFKNKTYFHFQNLDMKKFKI